MDRKFILTRPAAPSRTAGEFFFAHEWCLNPVLTIHDLRLRLEQSWRLFRSATVAWQQEECRINLYLLLCALDCTTNDYLAFRRWWPDAISRRLPRLRPAISELQTLADVADALGIPGDKQAVRRWRQALVRCVDAACRALVDHGAGAAEDWSFLEAELPALLGAPLPQRVLMWRMIIPEAFRCQDMTHHDVIAMAERFVAAFGAEADRPVFVVGPRTAGAYFAPLVHAFLLRSGVKTAGWITIRPKQGLSRIEEQRLRAACTGSQRLLIVDDHPNTGHTFTLMVALLRSLGALVQNMVILAPDHPAQTAWKPLVRPVPVVTLAPADFAKARLLRDEARLRELLCDFLNERSGATLNLRTNAALDRINDALAAHYGDSFQVRLKRVFEVESRSPAAEPVRLTVLAKSVGWGWLGYHAYLAAARMHEFVPRLIGLRDGFMFIEWSGGQEWPGDPPPSEKIAAVVPKYVAARVTTLPLNEDPSASGVGLRRTGRERILEALQRPYGALIGRLVRPELDRRLAALVPPKPTLVDGRMNLENWVDCPSGVRKVDFEHHNFGGGEQDIVDPAYDLAGAIYALKLDPDAEDRLIDEYAARSGDAGVRGRLLLYKLLLGLLTIEKAQNALRHPLEPERLREEHLRYLAGRNFLTFHFNRHHAARIAVPADLAWSRRLFSLDLDGVFDTQPFDVFPCSTATGLRALGLLRVHGYSVMPNTARSIENVIEFCNSYGLPGGIAEHGCIFVDRVAGREEFLVGPDAAQELARCRAFVEGLPGLTCDPGYKAAVRFFQHRDGVLSGIPLAEAQEILRKGGFPGLDVITTKAETFFLPKGVNKGTALAAVRSKLAVPPELVVAMGDSDQDLEMLRQADLAYVPANGSARLRESIRSSKKVHLMRQARQLGMLQAVEHLIREAGSAVSPPFEGRTEDLVRPSEHIIDVAIEARAIRQHCGALFGCQYRPDCGRAAT